MRKVVFILGAILGLMAFTGCSQDSLTISKCAKYDKGMCVSKKQIPVVKCKNPITVGKETYCSK